MTGRKVNGGRGEDQKGAGDGGTAGGPRQVMRKRVSAGGRSPRAPLLESEEAAVWRVPGARLTRPSRLSPGTPSSRFTPSYTRNNGFTPIRLTLCQL